MPPKRRTDQFAVGEKLTCNQLTEWYQRLGDDIAYLEGERDTVGVDRDIADLETARDNIRSRRDNKCKGGGGRRRRSGRKKKSKKRRSSKKRRRRRRTRRR